MKKIWFQCLGISGLILLFYGLLAFAVTQVSTMFFWSLTCVGAICLMIFIVTSLSGPMQAAVATLVAVNLPWISTVAGKSWPMWALGATCGVCVLVLAAINARRVSPATLGAALFVVAGGTAALLYFKDNPWVGYGRLAAFFLFNGAFLYLSREILKDMFGKRSLRMGTNAAVYSVIVVAIIIVANVLSQDVHHQWDFTEEKVNTLTDQTTKVLSNLKTPLKITAFVDDQNQAKPYLKDILELYKGGSKNVSVEFVDPDKQNELAVAHNAKDGDILIEFDGQSHITQTPTEEGLTQAILKVARTDNPTVCFTKGHGELDIDGTDEDKRGLSAIKGGLENEGYKPKAITSILPDVPGDCAMFVVAGPLQAFTSEEAESVDRYLGRGGHGLFLLDPNIPDPRLATKDFGVLRTGLEDVLKKWGVQIGRDTILEKHMQIFRGVQIGLTVIAQEYGNHPIVDPLKGRQTVFQDVRSVRKAAGFTGTATDLVSSAPEGASWAETDVAALYRQKSATQGSDDIAGPVPIAVASEKEPQDKTTGVPTRLVVFGDGDFASNGMIRSYEFNVDLFLNSLSWLQGTKEQMSIRPKKIRTSAIELSAEQSNTIFYLAIITLPMIVLIFGMDLWWWRRRRG